MRINSKLVLFLLLGSLALCFFPFLQEQGFKLEGYSAKKMDLRDGKSIYKAKCSQCHGNSGKGDGSLGKLMKSIGDFSKPSMNNKTDQELFDKVTKGKALMPSFRRKLTEEQRWAVVKHIRSFVPENKNED